MQHINLTLDTFHLEMSVLNDAAVLNMPYMLVTVDTSHLEMSPLNNVLCLNNQRVTVAAEISQDPIVPCGPSEQSVDSL